MLGADPAEAQTAQHTQVTAVSSINAIVSAERSILYDQATLCPEPKLDNDDLVPPGVLEATASFRRM
eukprot:scaffold138000_cov48-Prasinocladus_malaysianus.AAC.1